MTRLGLLLALIVASGFDLAAQQVAPAFEVASIKPQTDPRPRRGASPPDRFIDPDTTLRGLIEYGYELTATQIVGGPEWGASRRFAVNAKATGTPSRAEMRLLVRALVAQRFNLKAHNETRELPVYVLERVRPNGPLGPALRATPTSECAAPVVALGPPGKPGEGPPCGVISASPVRIIARGVAMFALDDPAAKYLPEHPTRLPKFELFAEGQTAFFARVTDQHITFETGPDGRATGLIVHKAGRDMPGVRLS